MGEDKDKSKTFSVCGGGITFGTIAAGLLSWAQWKSIGWALFHAWLGWIYIFCWFLSCVQKAPLVFP